MELEGEQLILAQRQHVWDALNDPNVLLKCIPGCEELKKISDNELEARLLAKVGPVRARFNGKVMISDQVAPSSYTLHFEGSGGAAGIAKGRSVVTLHADGDHTRLHYTVQASVGGKLGQIGGRLIDASAKKMASDFFRTFNDQVAPAGKVALTDSMPAVRVQAAKTATPSTPVVAASHALVASGSEWAKEFQRVLWLAIGIVLGAGLAHFWHV